MNRTRTLLLSALSLAALTLGAQAPQSFSYQAVARDVDGDPLDLAPLLVSFQLHHGTAVGPVVFAESHSTATNDHGLFTLQVGNGTASVGTFSAIDWRSGPYFLEVLLDASSSGSFTSMGTQQLLSVPYALHAGSSSNVPDGTEVGQIMHWTGTAWAADSGLYVQGKRFGIGITTPESPLGIAADTTDGAAIKLYQASSSTGPGPFNPLAWNINLNPSNSDVAGFSIDDASTGTSVSRLFIADSTGHVGIGTQDPPAPLALVSRNVLKQYFQTGDHPSQSQFGFTLTDTTGFGIEQGIPGSMTSRLFIQSSTGHVGIGNTDPGAPLSIKDRNTLYEEFKNGDIPNENDFVISSGGNTGLSFDQDTTGGYASRLAINSSTGHVGIGTNDPPAALSIESRDILKTYFETGDVPTADQFGISTGATGFDIGQGAPGALTSRIFISKNKGSVGIGTTAPAQKLHIEESTTSGITGIRILNTATAANNGFTLGHRSHASTEQDGAFSIIEETALDPVERITVRSGGNVGINEKIPDTKLHVSRDLAEPGAALSLIEGTGIMVVGPITDNIVADYRGIQARHGDYVGSTLDLTTSTLNLQRLGGDILIHGDDAVDHQVSITGDGKIGIGKAATEKLEINGAVVVGTTDNVAPSDGTIRWNTATEDLEGFVGTAWTSLTSGGWEKVDNTDVIVAAGAHPKVGIGTSTPSSSLRVDSWAAVVERSIGVHFQNTSTTSSTNPMDNRVGLQLENSSSWGGSAASKDIGLYVSQVTGQSEASSNIGALINGNVVIGDVTNGQVVGTNGSRVLSIQNGTVPATGLSSGPGSVGGVQVYSADVSGVPTLHVMTGDGAVMRLYRQPDMTAADASAVGPVYDPTTAVLIENMRTRINELEQILKAVGLLTP